LNTSHYTLLYINWRKTTSKWVDCQSVHYSYTLC